MSGGGRPPNTAPSLPLHSSSSSPSNPLDSLQTPDTSSLFISSLGSHAGPRTAEFTSLEDLLNFSGIAQQTSSLEVIARDLEQKAVGPPEAKRICPDRTLSPSSSVTLPSSNVPSTVLVSPLPQLKSSLPATRNSVTSSLGIPTLLPSSRQSLPSAQHTTPATVSQGTRPGVGMRPLLAGSTVRLVTGSSPTPHPASSSTPAPPSASLSASSVNSSLPPLTSTPVTTSLVVPSILAQSTTSASFPPLPLSTSLQLPYSNVLPTTSSSASRTNPGPPSLPSLPANPAQRALLVQLVQAYKQCSALGDTQGQAKVKAQLNLLLQAQQKMAAIAPSNHTNLLHPAAGRASTMLASSLPTLPGTVSSNTSCISPSPLMNTTSSALLTPTNTSLLNTSMLTPAKTVLLSTSQSTPLTLSQPTNSAKGVEPVAMGNSQFPQKQGAQATPTSHPLTPLSTQTRVSAPSGSASALKAAALYNLRLRQLQLFLQSLPEDQRPHSIPELKALLQKSGGPLGALTAAPATSLSSAPVPTLLSSSSAPPSAPSLPVPTVGQCLPQLTQDPPTTSLSATVAPSTTASLLRSLAQGSLPLSPTSLSRFTGSQLSAAPPYPSHLPATGTTSTPILTTVRPPLTSATLLHTTGTTATPLHTTGTTATPLHTTGTTATPLHTTGTTGTPLHTLQQTNPQPVVSDVNKTLPSSTANSEPIKPGVPTPLPPGVNPETLGVLCRMPDSDLQKLKLPPVLMTAIRVWRGQQGTGRGRKAVGSQAVPIIIPPATSSSSLPSTSSHQSTSTVQTPTARPLSTSRPATRHQVRAEQNKAEKDRLAALNKVLQSSEEARIAYRFNMLRDKMTNQLKSPDSQTPFKSLHDVIARLLPYHMWSEAEPPPGAIEKADAVYESVAQVLMSRSHGLMSNYQHLVYHDARRDSEAVMAVCLERHWQESERERREQESLQSQQAARVAADLMIAGALGSGPLCGLDFDAEFAFEDVMNSDPMLTFEPGIT